MPIPEQPKRVTGGAFGQFLNQKRAALTEECKGKPVTAVVKRASEMFKALSDAERMPYETLYKQAAAKYEKDLAAFKAAGGEIQKKEPKKKRGDDKKAKTKKDPEAPKKPVGGAYGCYMDAMRASLAKEVQNVKEVAKLGSERWKALSAEERKPYEKAYAEKAKAYEEAKKNYVPPPVVEAPSDEGGNSEEKKSRGAKKQKATAQDPTPEKTESRASKRGRTAKTAGGDPDKVSVDAAVLAEAKELGFESALNNLANRKEVIAKHATSRQMLDALKQSAGLVNKAKDAVLAM